MRKRIITLLLVLLCLAAALPAAAEEGTVKQDTAFRAVIEDRADLLSADEYDSVLVEMGSVTEYCNAGFFTTEEFYSGTGITRAEEWGKEVFGNTADIVVFLIDMRAREITVWASEGIDKTLPTAKGRQIVGNVYKMATKGQYAECAEEAFREIYTVLNGGKAVDFMHYVGNALMALAAAILLAYLLISARMEQEVKVSLPGVVTATAGVGAAIVAKQLTRVVHHESSSGHGGHGGGGFGGGGGGGHGSGASHGF